MLIKRKICMLILFIICITAGCEAKTTSDKGTETPIVNVLVREAKEQRFPELPEGIQKIMCSDGEFFDVEMEKTFTKDSYQWHLPQNADKADPVYWLSFMMSDLDSDGEKELIFQIGSKDRIVPENRTAIRIFDWQEDTDTVYCYSFADNEISVLYEEDAMIYGRIGQDEDAYYTLWFDGKECRKTIMAEETHRLNQKGEYIVRGNPVTWREYDDFEYEFSRSHQTEVLWEDYEGAEFAGLPEGIQNIMYANGEFFDAKQGKTFTKASYENDWEESALEESSLEESEDSNADKMCWQQYIIFDLDEDGEKELIFLIGRDWQESKVHFFDEQNGMVYCYPVNFEFEQLYHDGTFQGEDEYYRLSFSGEQCHKTIVAGNFDSDYAVLGNIVSEQEYDTFLKENHYNGSNGLSWED